METLKFDLGNSNYKIIADKKRIIDSSNVEEVKEGTFGAWVVNGKSYLFGEGARSKKSTNKITEDKKALLGRALYPIVADKKAVAITVLLPLSLYVDVSNREKYQELLKGKYTVTNTNEATKEFEVKSVEVCCEGYSSLVTDAKLLQEALYLIDIGGVDLTGTYVNRTPVVSQSFTLEKGMNIFFTELGKVLTSKLLETYTNKDAELMYQKYSNLSDDIKQIIDEFAKDYIQKNIYQQLKDIGYKPFLHKLVFVGGGSIALNRYLSEDSNVTILDNALWSNVEGASLISQRRNRNAN